MNAAMINNIDFVIKEEEVSDEEIENTQRKQPKVSAEQYDKVKAFYRKHPAEAIGRDVLNQLWNDLAIQLNKLGPPVHSVAVWRRKYAIHKYNQKRQQSTRPMRTLRGSQSPLDQSPPHPVQMVHVENSISLLGKLSEISDKLSEISSKLSELSGKHDLVIQLLQQEPE